MMLLSLRLARDLLATSAVPTEESLQSAIKEGKRGREKHRDSCCSAEAMKNG